MGDLNANMLLSSDKNVKFLKELAIDLRLKLVDHRATHHVRESHTWIDVIYVADNDVVCDVKRTRASFPTKHDIIDVTIDVQTSKPPTVGIDGFLNRDFSTSIASFSRVNFDMKCNFQIYRSEMKN